MKAEYVIALLRPQNQVWSPAMDKLYIPAIMPTSLRNDWTLRPLNWLDPKGGPFGTFHPFALLSYPFWRTTRTEFPPSTFVMGDSGGYTIASRGEIIPPRAAMQWQMDNCTIGFIVDHPPQECAGKPAPPEGHKADYTRCLEETLLNVELALPIYLRARGDRADIRLWGVAHGANRRELRHWYDKVGQLYPFTEDGEGWGLKIPGQKTPAKAARWMRFVQEKGIKRAHFFQAGGPTILATTLVLGPPAGLEWLSTDSSSPITSGNNRGLLTLAKDGLGYGPIIAEKFRGTDGEDRRAREWMLERCPCASCRWLTEDSEDHPDLIDGEVWDEYWKYRFGFHNVILTLRMFRNLQHAAENDPEGLLRHKLGRDYDATMTAFDGLALKGPST